jgi:hypothetical protein
VNGVDKKFTIPYDKLGTLQFLDNSGREPAVSSDLIFEEAKTPAEDVLPQLKIEKMKWEEIITDKWDTIVPESLEKTVTKEVLEYFRGWESSDVIISFRTKNKTAFDNFYKFVEAGGKENYAKAAKLFHDYLTSKSLATNATITSEIKNAFVADNGMLKGNVDFIYGALSRVRKTQDKQFGTVAKGEDQEKYMEAAKNKLVDTANDLIDNASKYGGLTLKGGKNKEELKALVKTRIIENPANTDTFTKLLAVIGNPSNKSTPNNVNDRLRFMLADFKELIGTRDASFVSRLKNEKINGKKISSVAVTEMTDARKAVKDTLNFPFDNAKEWKGVGLVFGYDHGSNGGGHHEKFINSPLIIQKEQKNLEPLTNPDTKEYFLRNLANFQKEDNALAQTAKNINLFIKEKLGIEGKVTMEQIINYLVNPKSPLKFDKDPKNHLEITLDTNFQFAFFADCINESILMGPIKINPS